jgi:hypothetical protein
MCDPVTIGIATLVAGTLQSVVQYQAASAQAQAQAQVEQQRVADQNRYMVENATNAVKAFGENAAQVGIRSVQQQAADAQEIERQKLEARKAGATAAASAKSGGLGLTMILNDYTRQAGNAVNTIETNAKWRTAQDRQEMVGFSAQATDAINSVRPYIPQPVFRPSPLGLVANLGTNALGAYSTYSTLKHQQQGKA